MKIGTTKEKLLNAVQAAERLIGKKESLPVLSCILLEATEESKELIVRSTNLEAGIEIHVPCEITEAGKVAISASVFSQTLRSISGDTITLSTEDSNMLLSSRGTKTLIKAIPHDEFPAFGAASENMKGVSVVREKLLRALQSVSYAASTSMIRPELGSVCVSITAQGLVCVATDSFRLAERTVASASADDLGDILVPLRHAAELIHALERMRGEKVEIATDESQIIVSDGVIRFMCRIIDGTFPNYKEIIPKMFTAEATTLKSDFAEMLKKARVFAGADQHIGLHVYPSKKIFSATAQSAAVGEMSDTIDAALNGDDLDINFNIGYIADCLTHIPADSIILGFAGPGRPLVIRGVNDSTFTYLVMPLNR